MKRNPIETVMGAVVLAVAGFFLFFAYTSADKGVVKGYEVTASFFKAGGIEEGSDVMISGIKIGSVISQRMNTEDYTAELTLSIKPDIKLPVDTVASIGSSSLMGGKHIKLKPGDSKEYIKAGEFIKKTKDYKALEDSVSEIIFLATN
ncbi:MAG: MCE family protein [Alphaproteobacteria bacterium]|nr:MCE family protein [Alphaproteobacteria bacterium]